MAFLLLRVGCKQMLSQALGRLWAHFNSGFILPPDGSVLWLFTATFQSSSSRLTKQWQCIYVLLLNMGNLPGHCGSGIKRLSFEKRLPWAEVFIFSSHPLIQTKAIYINCRLKLSISGSQLAPLLAGQDSKTLVTALVKVSDHCFS